MRQNRKAVALERMRTLVANASANLRAEPALAERQAALAWRICTHTRTRMPYELRMAFCRKCKSFVGYGQRVRIRVGNGEVRLTCGLCGHVRRKVLHGVSTPGSACSNGRDPADPSGTRAPDGTAGLPRPG